MGLSLSQSYFWLEAQSVALPGADQAKGSGCPRVPGFGASGSALRAVPSCPQAAETALFGVHFPAVQGLAQLSPPSPSAFVSKPLGSWIFSFKPSSAWSEGNSKSWWGLSPASSERLHLLGAVRASPGSARGSQLKSV